MKFTYSWQESYIAAVLETDWTKMHERIQAAESAIDERQRILSLDHGGTEEERQAIHNSINGLKGLRSDTSHWLARQPHQEWMPSSMRPAS